MNKENSSTTEKTEPKKLKYFIDCRSSDPIFKDWLSKDRGNTGQNVPYATK